MAKDVVVKMNDKRWQAEFDARTMAEYQAIVNDKSRMKRAIAEAKRQADDLTKRANAMKQVSNSKRK